MYKRYIGKKCKIVWQDDRSKAVVGVVLDFNEKNKAILIKTEYNEILIKTDSIITISEYLGQNGNQ